MECLKKTGKTAGKKGVYPGVCPAEQRLGGRLCGAAAFGAAGDGGSDL